MAETVWWSEVESEFGTFGLASTERGLLALFLPRETPDHLKTIQHLTGGLDAGVAAVDPGDR